MWPQYGVLDSADVLVVCVFAGVVLVFHFSLFLLAYCMPCVFSPYTVGCMVTYYIFFINLEMTLALSSGSAILVISSTSVSM